MCSYGSEHIAYKKGHCYIAEPSKQPHVKNAKKLHNQMACQTETSMDQTAGHITQAWSHKHSLAPADTDETPCLMCRRDETIQTCILSKTESPPLTKLRGMLGYGHVLRQRLRGSSADGRGPCVALQDADHLGAHLDSWHPSPTHRHPAVSQTL